MAPGLDISLVKTASSTTSILRLTALDLIRDLKKKENYIETID